MLGDAKCLPSQQEEPGCVDLHAAATSYSCCIRSESFCLLPDAQSSSTPRVADLGSRGLSKLKPGGVAECDDCVMLALTLELSCDAWGGSMWPRTNP